MSAPQKKRPSSHLSIAVNAVVGLVVGLIIALVIMDLSIPLGIAFALPVSAAMGLAAASKTSGSC
ncbi:MULTISPECIES: hypothetical protein [Brevibacterium]|uniref:hypothetical protein n=1 Tax=Brevibacterium TaxID=1696 RepID=UPI00223BE0F7|nr:MULTISPECIES: hypothetical protein [Brevibacterium]MCT1872418.1 hypothetical protein [Brevibacterium luteolum]MCT1890158.1 hypothetical protein [Brevibacterium luteolum]MCT1892678.1 hypothetical protein [Brevibacterium luteolum]MCT1920516.1 hypothetical protein [Brevibacterium luteolum]MCT1923335.1 hypothetical protein [Brevibacterium luteolum]